MENKTPYNWKFTKLGGVTRVSIETGDDIAHLGELDQKMWTVLSCPTTGLEFDEKTLRLMDLDHDGKIRVHEVIEATKWITSVLKDPDILINPQDELPLSAISQENPEGKKLYDCAKQILTNLGLEKDTISMVDTSDPVKIFAETKLNGDGVVTEKSTDDEDLKSIIKLIGEKAGTAVDRSGEPGINKDHVEAFYKAAAEYEQWQGKASEATMPYGDKTADAYSAYMAIKDKVDDYFIRCKVASFNEEQKSALEMTSEQLSAISPHNLATNISELEQYPLARITGRAELTFDETVNPAWQGRVAAFKALVFDKRHTGRNSMTEQEWIESGDSFAAYKAWMSEKAGIMVEDMGSDGVKALLSNSREDDLLNLISQDAAMADEANEVEQVDKLLHIHKHLHLFLRNFVTFSDFYSSDRSVRSIFQAGTLFIDQRSCDLCLRVTDMAKHNATAAASGMFLIYCDCVSKVKRQTMTIVAVMTDGDIDNLTVGKNAVFYDRDGLDWDATVTKIVDNPISIRQAFWSPYRKMNKFINDQINKFAQEKDSKMTEEAMTKIQEGGTKMSTTTTAAKSDETKAKAFDIARYCGIFAAIGLALGYIGELLSGLWHGFTALTFIGKILAVMGLMLVISGPSMLLAWMSLRKRNLSPLLNANGWAVNAQAYVNIVFGATLTKIAKFPVLSISDPFADKGAPKWKIALGIAIILVAIFALLYFNNILSLVGLPYKGSSIADFIDGISLVDPSALPVDTATVSTDVAQ